MLKVHFVNISRRYPQPSPLIERQALIAAAGIYEPPF